MTIRSQISMGSLVLLILGCSLFCIAAMADEAAVGGDTGYFEITSEPSGGAVTFDGSYKGTTPVTFPVYVTGSPTHTIKVTKAGYNDWEQTYQGNPASGQTITVNDTKAPVWTSPLPQDLTLQCGEAVPAAATLTASDN
ncbi:MAG TPA: PEGA domain-containing protein, partial [Methanoregulaceae archaeon]|nr:PEGA domain-containing protein [Methanoregulaceae archaeon]